MCILTILKEHTSENNSIKSSEISYITGYRGKDIRAEINRLRTSGVPVCSSNKGYYIATDKKEVYKTIANLSSRIYSMNEAIEGLSKSLLKLEEEVANG